MVGGGTPDLVSPRRKDQSCWASSPLPLGEGGGDGHAGRRRGGEGGRGDGKGREGGRGGKGVVVHTRKVIKDVSEFFIVGFKTALIPRGRKVEVGVR